MRNFKNTEKSFKDGGKIPWPPGPREKRKASDMEPNILRNDQGEYKSESQGTISKFDTNGSLRYRYRERKETENK